MKHSLRKYDIILVDFGNDVIGSEQGGTRPALIIQNNVGNQYSPTTIVMPLSTKLGKHKLPTHTIIPSGKETGLNKDSLVLGEAIRQISEERIKKYIGCLVNEVQKQEIRRVYQANFGE